MKVTAKIKLDLRSQNYGSSVCAVQGDGGSRCVEAALLDGGEPWNVPAGVTAAVAYKKPDFTKGLYDKLADDTPAVTVSGSTVTVVLAKQMLTVPGSVQACIVFNNAALDQLTTFPFTVVVAANPVIGAEPSDDYIRLQWLEEKLDEYLEKFAGGVTDEAVVQRIVDEYLAANPPEVTETDPTVPAWAKQPTKPTYTAAEVGALPDTYTPPSQTAQQVGADPAGTAASAVSQHNTDATAHNDLRLALQGLSDRINAALDSDDATLDQMSEVVAYIKSNKSLIDAITTSKVSVADIVNDLVTNVADKPLSAAQGVALKQLIDDLQAIIPGEGGSGIAVTGATVGQTVKIAAVDDDGVPTAWEPVDLPSGGAENDNDWEIINTITFEEEGITSFTIDKDQNGNQFELSDMLIRSNVHASLGGTSATSARTNLMINGKLTTYSMGNITSGARCWNAIATLINGRVYYGYSDFSSKTSQDNPVSIQPMQNNLGALYNDDSITSVGINILNPGEEYFAVGYEITLWGRRKK